MANSSMYSQLVAEAPQSARIYSDLASVGPLDARTRRLVKLGVAAALISEGAVKHHAGKAIREGLPPDELRHAVTLALIMAGPGALRVLRWTEEAITGNHTLPKSLFETLLKKNHGDRTYE